MLCEIILFDITMESDAYHETQVPRMDGVIYSNALKIVKLLIPGLKSYALDHVHKFGFQSF